MCQECSLTNGVGCQALRRVVKRIPCSTAPIRPLSSFTLRRPIPEAAAPWSSQGRARARRCKGWDGGKRRGGRPQRGGASLLHLLRSNQAWPPCCWQVWRARARSGSVIQALPLCWEVLCGIAQLQCRCRAGEALCRRFCLRVLLHMAPPLTPFVGHTRRVGRPMVFGSAGCRVRHPCRGVVRASV